MPIYGSGPSNSRRQRGAVLYIALIMLVLLALIGIVGMQVSGLQERMAANYRAVNIAFQDAETRARAVEGQVLASVSGGVGTFAADQEICEPTFDPLTWADDLVAGEDVEGVFTRRVDKCFAASSLRVGERLNEETGNIYEISVMGNDAVADNAATAVINTIYIP